MGSYGKRLAGEEIESEDFDLLVPHDKWQVIALMIPSTAKVNKFGGWRFETECGKEVDVWPGDLYQYLTECRTKHGGPVVAVDFIQNRIFTSVIRDLTLD